MTWTHPVDKRDKASTTFSAFYTAQSGSPYSYIYSNPIAEISQSAGTADLIYVPANQGDINLVDIPGGASASAQWSALDNFISNNDYLNSRRGDYAEANKLRTPFENVIDIKITQDFYMDDKKGTRHTLQITFDIFNFTNLLNKNWGRRYFVDDSMFPIIQSTINSDTGAAEFNFVEPGDTFSISQSGPTGSRWIGQFGLRYSF